jgi:hypothetical protein
MLYLKEIAESEFTSKNSQPETYIPVFYKPDTFDYYMN